MARSSAKLDAFAATHANKSGVFQPIVCELSDFDSVAAAADQVVKSLDGGSLDFLVRLNTLQIAIRIHLNTSIFL
jgi:hypothetical protein